MKANLIMLPFTCKEKVCGGEGGKSVGRNILRISFLYLTRKVPDSGLSLGIPTRDFLFPNKCRDNAFK
jgi:hypothetical protein